MECAGPSPFCPHFPDSLTIHGRADLSYLFSPGEEQIKEMTKQTNSPGSGVRVFKCYLCLAHLPLKPSLPGSDIPSGLNAPFLLCSWEETGPAGCRNSHFRAHKGDKRQSSEPCREEADMFLMAFVTHRVAYVEDPEVGHVSRALSCSSCWAHRAHPQSFCRQMMI